MMQRYHLGGGLERSTESPRIYDFSFFPENRTFETVIAAKTIHYVDLDSKDH